MDDILERINQTSLVSLLVPAFIIVLLVMMILPLPTIFLDILFTFNIVFSLIVILASIYCRRPLDFAVFPTILLLATLLRLVLNIASTRIVLLNGHTGTDAAGQVIQSFGQVVIGGNYTVGLVIFLILVVINFVVITKGAGRVSEVSARFALDSLPGKQMAIDSDLNSGSITHEEAGLRRDELVAESDFYGSMDGASKFVRGDAVAGMVILFINIVGGIIIGLTQHGMSLTRAGQNYILLTIGDGLAAQIPALLLSTAAAVMVTRFSRSHDMGNALVKQVFSNSHSLWVAAIILFVLGIIPNMPHLVFLSFSCLMGLAAFYSGKGQNEEDKVNSGEKSLESRGLKNLSEDPLTLDDVCSAKTLSVEIGYRLIPLVDIKSNDNLLSNIKEIRRRLSIKFGFLFPKVQINDNLDLEPFGYRLIIDGVVLSEGRIYLDKFLAVNPGGPRRTLMGEKVLDPICSLEAYWINNSEKEHAENEGFTIIDPKLVIATHLSHVIEANVHKLLGFSETEALLNKLSETSPKLVQELTPSRLSISVINKTLQMLLIEGIPLTDFKGIAESLIVAASNSTDPKELLKAVRLSISSLITQIVSGDFNELSIVTISPALGKKIEKMSRVSNSPLFDSEEVHQIQGIIYQYIRTRENRDSRIVFVVQADLRQFLARFVRVISTKIHVLSFDEIPETRRIKIVGSIG